MKNTYKYEDRNCLFCWKEYSPKKKWQKFCNKECAYWHLKEQRKIEKTKKTNPSFSCPKCWRLRLLDFDPLKNYSKWKNFKCECWYSPSDE